MAWGRRRPEPEPEPQWHDPLWVPQPVERWITPEEIAARQRKHRRRWRALRHAVVMLLVITVVGGTGVVAAGAVLGRWALPFVDPPSAAPSTEPTQAPTIGVDCEPAQVRAASASGTSVTVLNGTERNGLAGGVADDLEERDFTIAEVGNAGAELEGAVIRFPPNSEEAALAVAAHVPDAVLRPDEEVGVVTLVLGEAWPGLREPAEVREVAAEPQQSLVTCADGTQGEGAGTDGSSPQPSDATG